MTALTYNPDVIALAARCSQLAYLREHAFGREAAALGLTGVRRISGLLTDTQGFIARRDNNVLVCFRGSESAQDWVTDLSAHQAAWRRNQRVHEGFRAAHLEAWPGACRELLAAINASPSLNVIITGHSLGGALALLAARDAVDAQPTLAVRMCVVTFGGPRVGNRAWAGAYDRHLRDCTFRVVNEEDPVARVPLACRGYQHVGREIFFTHLGQRLTDPPLWFKLISDAFGLWSDLRRGRLAIVTDHCVSNYVRLTRDTRES